MGVNKIYEEIQKQTKSVYAGYTVSSNSLRIWSTSLVSKYYTVRQLSTTFTTPIMHKIIGKLKEIIETIKSKKAKRNLTQSPPPIRTY